MDWQRMDFPTRAGFVGTVMTVLAVVVPPASVGFAVPAIGFSGYAWFRSSRRGQPNPVARNCLIGCVVLTALLVIGNLAYAAGG